MKKCFCSLVACLGLFVLMLGQYGFTPKAVRTVTVMTHDSFSISKELVEAFETEHNAHLRFLKAGSVGEALEQAIRTRRRPVADVFYGVDNTFMSRALDAGIFAPYASPRLADVPDRFRLDPRNRLLPVGYGDVCLNYDKRWFSHRGLAPPGGLEDLVKPYYRDLTVVENPATSSPGFAFLLATIAHFGEDGYIDFWRALRDNGVMVVDGWKQAYWGHFSATTRGSRPIVVSYASSPVAEAFSEDTSTGVVIDGEAAFRQVEFVGILKGARDHELASRVVDFMLSPPFQEEIPFQMFVFPVNRSVEIPSPFLQHVRFPEQPVMMSPEKIEEGRREWVREWTRAVME